MRPRRGSRIARCPTDSVVCSAGRGSTTGRSDAACTASPLSAWRLEQHTEAETPRWALLWLNPADINNLGTRELLSEIAIGTPWHDSHGTLPPRSASISPAIRPS